MIGTLGQFVREIRDLLSGSGDPIPVDIQDASVTINGDVTVSSEVEVKNDTGNPIPVSQINAIDFGNGYSGTMTANQVFTGTGIEASPAYGTISVCVSSSHASAANGLKFQASIDNINWETIEQYTYSSPNVLESYSFAPSGRYFRLTYTNGGTSTTKTAIFSVLRSGYTKPSSHRVGDPISAEKDAELVKAVLAAMKPNGTFTDINATAGGNLKFSLEEAETSVVLGIKDAGNSITVDGPLTNTELRASAVPVSAASLPLPSGASTASNQAAGNTSLNNIDTKTPALQSGAVPVGDNSGSLTVDGRAYRAQVDITRPANTTAYAAGSVIGTGAGDDAILTLSSIGPSGGFVMVQSIELVLGISTVPSGMSSFRLHFYSTKPATAAANASAFDVTSTDRGAYIGYIDLPAPVDLGSTCFTQLDYPGKLFKLASASTSLFCELQTIGGFTPAANSEVYSLRIKTLEAGL